VQSKLNVGYVKLFTVAVKFNLCTSICCFWQRQLTSRAPGDYFFNYFVFVSCCNCVCEQISETTVCQVYQNEMHTVLSLKQAIGKKQNTRGC